jgi:hypothetical protein
MTSGAKATAVVAQQLPRNFFEAESRCVYPRNLSHRTKFDGARSARGAVARLRGARYSKEQLIG